MISEAQFQKELELIISNAIREDVGDGDHSSLACIPASAQGKAKLLVKDEGIIAGVEFAKMIFHYVDKEGITGVDFHGEIFQLHLFSTLLFAFTKDNELLLML